MKKTFQRFPSKEQLDLFEYASQYKNIHYDDSSRVAKREMKLIVDRSVNDDKQSILYNHKAFCQVFFPSRQIPETELEIKSGKVTTYFTSHKQPVLGGQSISPGLPYGAAARLLIYYFHTQAIKTQSRHIDLGKGISDLCQRLNVHRTSHYIKSIKEQLVRITSTSISSAYLSEEAKAQSNIFILSEYYIPNIKKGDILHSSVKKISGGDAYALLSPDYFDSFIKSAVPLDEMAINALKHSALQLDLYAWLSYRLHTITTRNKRETFIPWAGLKQQFGPNYTKIGDFKRDFRKALYHVKNVYRGANITEEPNRGFNLFPSPTPIQAKQKIYKIS